MGAGLVQGVVKVVQGVVKVVQGVVTVVPGEQDLCRDWGWYREWGWCRGEAVQGEERVQGVGWHSGRGGWAVKSSSL